MKSKLTLIALALIATVGIASAQNTQTKEVKPTKEKSCCPQTEQKATADKKDGKTVACPCSAKTTEKVAEKKQECTGNCTGNCEKKDVKAVKSDCCKDANGKVATKTAKKEECSGNCSDCDKDKKEVKKAACCEEQKAAPKSCCEVADKSAKPAKPAEPVKPAKVK